MSYSTIFRADYKGKDKQKFIKLFKVIVPYYDYYFDSFEKNGVMQISSRDDIGWHTANADLSKIISYFENGEKVVLYNEWESDNEQIEKTTIAKDQDGIIILHDNEDECKHNYNFLGVTRLIYEALSSGFDHSNPIEGLDVLSVDGYLRYVASVVGDDEEMLPIIQDFLYDAFDPEKVMAQTYSKNEISQEDLESLKNIRSKFQTVESTRAFLREKKQEGLLIKKKPIKENSLVDFMDKYPEEVADVIVMSNAKKLQDYIEKKSGYFYPSSKLRCYDYDYIHQYLMQILNMLGYVVDRHLIVYNSLGTELTQLEINGGVIKDGDKCLCVNIDNMYDTLKIEFDDKEIYLCLGSAKGKKYLREIQVKTKHVKLEIEERRNDSYSISQGDEKESTKEISIKTTRPECELLHYTSYVPSIGDHCFDDGRRLQVSTEDNNQFDFSSFNAEYIFNHSNTKDLIKYAYQLIETDIPEISELLKKIPFYEEAQTLPNDNSLGHYKSKEYIFTKPDEIEKKAGQIEAWLEKIKYPYYGSIDPKAMASSEAKQ